MHLALVRGSSAVSASQMELEMSEAIYKKAWVNLENPCVFRTDFVGYIKHLKQAAKIYSHYSWIWQELRPTLELYAQGAKSTYNSTGCFHCNMVT